MKLIRRSSIVIVLLALFETASIITWAQQPGGVVARIIVMKPKDGMQKQFEDGYKRHLEWHRRNNDSWSWYGWQIVEGRRVGYFMDGSFGHLWQDFDRPVSPAEDSHDVEVNVLPYAELLALSHYKMREDLSNQKTLEERKPSRLLKVEHYTVRPGHERDFETVLRALQKKPSLKLRQTWYQLTGGGAQSTYLRFVPLDKPSDLETQRSISSLIEENFPGPDGNRLLGLFQAAVLGVETETLLYRADLSYFPMSAG